jgi:hypothetical protein
LGDLKIDLSANVQSAGLWQMQGPSPVMNVSEADAEGAAPAATTIDVSDAALTDLSAAASFVVGSMRSEARITAALMKRAIDAYTSSRDDADETPRSSPAAGWLASDVAAASLFALQPLFAILRRPGL